MYVFFLQGSQTGLRPSKPPRCCPDVRGPPHGYQLRWPSFVWYHRPVLRLLRSLCWHRRVKSQPGHAEGAGCQLFKVNSEKPMQKVECHFYWRCPSTFVTFSTYNHGLLCFFFLNIYIFHLHLQIQLPARRAQGQSLRHVAEKMGSLHLRALLTLGCMRFLLQWKDCGVMNQRTYLYATGQRLFKRINIISADFTTTSRGSLRNERRGLGVKCLDISKEWRHQVVAF